MRLKSKADVVEDYIQQFRQFGTDVVDYFSHGMCYQCSLDNEPVNLDTHCMKGVEQQ